MIHLLIVERHATYEGPALEVIGIAAGVLGGLVVVGMLVLCSSHRRGGGAGAPTASRRCVRLAGFDDPTDVRTRLGEPTFTTRIKVGARSARVTSSTPTTRSSTPGCSSSSAATAAASEPRAGSARAERRRRLPTDVRHPALDEGLRGHRRIRSPRRLAQGDVVTSLFDTEDVYRVWVPSRHSLGFGRPDG